MNCESLVGKTIAGRFLATQMLKQGRSDATFLGTNLATGETVVIKALAVRELAPGAQMRLEHDATLRRRVSSPCLAPVVETLREDDVFYFVSRYVAGISLADRLRRGPLALADALAVGCSLFRALRDLHDQRVLHRNVNPANIVVADASPLEGAVLADMASLTDARADVLLREQDVEAAWYLSPEQAGSIDRDVGETSDLYAAGVVLFQCLAGRPPFAGETVSAVLFEHMTARVPELRSLGWEVPRALEEIVQRLLRKDPRDRYQTAEAVLEDLQTLREALERGEQDPYLVIGSRDRRGTLTEPAFVARTRELAILDEQVERAQRGQAGLLLVEARSGNGKTRLLVELAQRAACEGLWVLNGQATTAVAQRPFHLLEGVVERFVAAARSDPALVEEVRQKLGPQGAAVCAALPQLREVFPADEAEGLAPEAFGEARTLRALGEFLDALGDARRPVLLILDDCQWADELTCKLIGRWRIDDETATEPRHVMVVAAFRSEEAPPDHRLRKIQPAAHLHLGPLEPEEVRRLAESMAGPLPEQAAEVVVRLSEGNPFMASAVLRGLVESGALVAGPSGWRIESLALDNLQSSRHAASFLTRRIELLPPSTTEVLSVGAVLGKEFDLDIAARLTEQTPSEAIEAIDEARQRQLVWARPDGGQCVFVHDKIRAALLERLSRSQRRELHRRAARYLQQEAPQRTSELAYHFDAAGDTDNALRYALEAAEKARAQHSLEVAEQQYRIARRSAENSDAATRFRVAEGLGDVLMLRGRYDDAAPLLEYAASLADGRRAHAEINEKLAELAFKRGDKETATREFENTLRRLGCFVPRALPAFVVLLLWEAIVQVLHTLFPRWLVHRRRHPPPEEVRLQIRLFSRLTHGYWFTRGKVQTLWAHLRGMNLGERFPPTLELAHAYSEHAPVISLIPLFRRACAYSRRSLEIRQELGDLWGQGQSLTFYGCVLYYSSRFQECVEISRQAIRLLERMGDYWLVHIARYQLAASLYHLGDLHGAVEECRRNHKSGLELRDEQASGIILDVWTRAVGGILPEGILTVELQRERQDAQGSAQVLLAEGVRRLGANELPQAVEAFESAIAVARRAGIQNAYTLPNLAWLATALRLQAERCDPYHPRQRKRLLRKAERVVRRALRAARICANDVPHALREAALIAALQGKPDEALRLFHKSLVLAQRRHARYEYAQTLMACGRIGRELGWPHAEKQFAAAEALLQELLPAPEAPAGAGAAEGPATLSLADRFDTVLGAGRKIASALTKAAIYREAQAASLRLLRGEDCRVIELDDRNEANLDRRGDAGETCDLRMVARAVRAGRAVAFAEEVAQSTSDHAGAWEGSAICVPIHVRGRTAACLYVTHHQVRGLFGPDEERLADFIAAIAGAALENAEGFHQLQTLNATLEQRVAERTAAAEFRARELARSNEELERVANELRSTEEQLRVAIDAAQSANQAKTRFLTTMSHEIRTPMNGILGMTELALQTPLSPQQRNYLSIIKQSGGSLLALLNDVLDLSKIEAGRMELETIAFDIREVIGASVRLLAVTAAQKGVELICRAAPDTPAEILGDPTRLRQVVVNLVGNAIKFTSAGHVYVNLFVERPDDGPASLHLAVQDTGVGIPADKIHSIFQSFHQADSSTTRRFGGTGLGLSISSQLAGLMGGRVWVESELGRGSTFHFVVPLKLPAAPQGAVARLAGGGEAPLRGLQVLWFSDHPLNRRVYEESLAHAGAVVVAPTTCDDALAMLEAQADQDLYDLVVADLVGAAPEGFCLIERALASRRRDLPVVALAAAGKSCPLGDEVGDRFQLRTKPLFAGELIEAVLAAVGKPVAADDAGSADLSGESLASLHILLAEDGLVNQEVAVGLLEVVGHTVEVANNGREAVECFQRGAFDVVLMDLEMPEMDGLEATRCIRELERATGARTPIIAMTAHAVHGFRDRCLEGGMDGYITKPIDLHELLRVLHAVREPRTPAPCLA